MLIQWDFLTNPTAYSDHWTAGLKDKNFLPFYLWKMGLLLLPQCWYFMCMRKPAKPVAEFVLTHTWSCLHCLSVLQPSVQGHLATIDQIDGTFANFLYFRKPPAFAARSCLPPIALNSSLKGNFDPFGSNCKIHVNSEALGSNLEMHKNWH